MKEHILHVEGYLIHLEGIQGKGQHASGTPGDGASVGRLQWYGRMVDIQLSEAPGSMLSPENFAVAPRNI
jgi:hypothetical protein